MLKNKKILLGLSGSIAAYKTATLTRLLIKSGADVRVVMTKAATSFITPLTLSTLSRHTVIQDIATDEAWNNHVDLGLWADAMVVAPATANTLGKMAGGICDNMLAATYLSARCPVFIAPAMDLDMWKHPSTQENIRKLKSFGNTLIPVGHGELASGLTGEGRMAEPEEIIHFLSNYFSNHNVFKNQQVLITAGPTYENLDPVRFIGNRSSGKMGIALAQAFASKGAQVQLILGPTHLHSDHPSVYTSRVQSAGEMYEETLKHYEKSNIIILAAAVSDYRPAQVEKTKMKKADSTLHLNLEKTPDIAESLGQLKRNNQLLIGFALETDNEIKNAQAKLVKKNFDFIVLNSLRDKGAGFEVDTNKISILDNNNNIKNFELKSKQAVAEDIVNEVIKIKQKQIKPVL